MEVHSESLMASTQAWMSQHYFLAIIIVLIIVSIFWLLITIAVGASKSEHMKLPWKNGKERMLTPQEQVLYNKLAAADPVNSSKIKREYMNNKAESPVLIGKLY